MTHYTWDENAKGPPIHADPQRVGEYLDDLRQRCGGVLHPDDLVQDAENNPDCPVRFFFTWDDTEAAHKYRRAQARKIIARVTTVATTAGKKVTVRAFPSIKKEKGKQHYTHITVAMEDPDSVEYMEKQALKALTSWYRQYQSLETVKKAYEAGKLAFE